MKLRECFICVVALGSMALAQAGASSQATSSAAGSVNAAGQSASAGSQQSVEAELTKSVDAGKVKQGDAVEAKTTQAIKGAGSVDIPKGSKLMGHVTEVKAHSKESQGSTLGIAFDQAMLKGGQTVPFHAIIQAVAVPQTNMATNSDMGMDAGAGTTMPASSQSRQSAPLGGVGNTVGNAAGAVGNTAGEVASTTGSTVGNVGNTAGTAVGGSTAANLGANARGVTGIADVQLNSSRGANGSVLSSNSKNIKLNSGTHLMLQVMQP